MDAKNLKVGFSTLLSLMFGVVSALTVWFTLKGDVDIIKIHDIYQDAEIVKMQEKDKATDKNFIDLKQSMHEDKLEILKAIHEHQHK